MEKKLSERFLEKMTDESKKGISRFGKSSTKDWYPSNITEAIENGVIISMIYGEICVLEEMLQMAVAMESQFGESHYSDKLNEYKRKYL